MNKKLLIAYLTEFKKLKQGFRPKSSIELIDALIKNIQAGKIEQWGLMNGV